MQVKVLLSTFIKLPFAIQIFILSIFEWPFYTGFYVLMYEGVGFALLILSFFT